MCVRWLQNNLRLRSAKQEAVNAAHQCCKGAEKRDGLLFRKPSRRQMAKSRQHLQVWRGGKALQQRQRQGIGSGNQTGRAYTKLRWALAWVRWWNGRAMRVWGHAAGSLGEAGPVKEHLRKAESGGSRIMWESSANWVQTLILPLVIILWTAPSQQIVISTYYMPGASKSSQPRRKYCYYLHFTDKEAEAPWVK